jgi:hypothetical protein
MSEDNPDSKSADSDQTPLPPLIVETNTHKQIQAPQRRNQDAETERKKSLRRSWRSSSPITKLTVIFTGVIAVATVLYCLFSGWQLYEIHSGSKDTHELALAAKQQAVAMDTSNSRAKLALDASIEASRMDQRAWVEVEPIKAIFIAPADDKFGATFKFQIYPRNVGRTAAYDIVVRAENAGSSGEFGHNLRGITMTQDRLFKDAATGARITDPPPNPIPKVLAPGTVSPVPFTLAGQEPKRFDTGTVLYEYLIGRIDYTDIFRVNHWMRFCFILINGRGELSSCEVGNDEDRNPEKPPN